ncbi:hypothetical protein ABT294_12410 [Nonomuraea sp. NPDC000554]|uniref:WXG100 family type VII secretion target n=1 Tax=Nonomuraea sp. NPDC000554 TaxID=3154259 RepID=UPI00332BBA1E
MGLTVPPEVDALFSLIGVPFPNVDEDEMLAHADAWRTVGDHITTVTDGSDRTVHQVMDGYQGRSAAELAGYWQETGGGGHLQQAATAARTAPAILEGAASVVTAGKVASVSQVLSLAQAGPALLAGGVGGALAAARIYAARRSVQRINRQVSEGLGNRLGSVLAGRVREPMERVLGSLRAPGLGGPVPAGGPGRLPSSPLRDPYAPERPGGGLSLPIFRKNAPSKSNSGTSRWGSRDEALEEAKEDAKRGGRAKVREECSKGDHVHVDYVNKNGEISHTKHYPYNKK